MQRLNIGGVAQLIGVGAQDRHYTCHMYTMRPPMLIAGNDFRSDTVLVVQTVKNERASVVFIPATEYGQEVEGAWKVYASKNATDIKEALEEAGYVQDTSGLLAN